jgi:hypothetical protein
MVPKNPFELIFSGSRFLNDDIDGIHQLWKKNEFLWGNFLIKYGFLNNND